MNREQKTLIETWLSGLVEDYPTEYRLRALRDLLNTREAVPRVDPEYVSGLAVAIMEERFAEPCYAQELIEPLREAGVALPEDQKRASNAISAILQRRFDLFRKYPGMGEKATARWGLVNGDAVKVLGVTK